VRDKDDGEKGRMQQDDENWREEETRTKRTSRKGRRKQTKAETNGKYELRKKIFT
jgi:hypothetical protein